MTSAIRSQFMSLTAPSTSVNASTGRYCLRTSQELSPSTFLRVQSASPPHIHGAQIHVLNRCFLPSLPLSLSVAYSVFMMHRRKDYWGPDGMHLHLAITCLHATYTSPAAYFDPDRFLDERLNKYFTGNPFIFLPFNAGPRICLGQQVRSTKKAKGLSGLCNGTHAAHVI